MNPNVKLRTVSQPVEHRWFLNLLAEGCESLFFEWPKKSNQKKGHPTIWSLRDYPALLAFIGAKINSLRSDKFLLNPMKAAMLGCIEGAKVKKPNSKPSPWNLRRSSAPSSLAEHRRDFAGKRAVSEGAQRPSFARAQNAEERKVPRKARRGIRVAFLLVPFLWPHKEKAHAASAGKKLKQLNE